MAAHRDPKEIIADMRRARLQLQALGREYAAAVYAKQLVKAPTRWHGAALEALRNEYENTCRTLSNLADRHHTSAGNICNLARQHDWVRRALRERLEPRSAVKPARPVAHSVAVSP